MNTLAKAVKISFFRILEIKVLHQSENCCLQITADSQNSEPCMWSLISSPATSKLYSGLENLQSHGYSNRDNQQLSSHWRGHNGFGTPPMPRFQRIITIWPACCKPPWSGPVLSLFDLLLCSLRKNSTHGAFVEIVGGIYLTLQPPEVAVPVIAKKRLTKNFKASVRYQWGLLKSLDVCMGIFKTTCICRVMCKPKKELRRLKVLTSGRPWVSVRAGGEGCGRAINCCVEGVPQQA